MQICKLAADQSSERMLCPHASLQNEIVGDPSVNRHFNDGLRPLQLTKRVEMVSVKALFQLDPAKSK